jgi:hypothetical protein
VVKGVNIEIAPLDEDPVRAKVTWSEQDVGGGKLVVEVTVKNMKTRPKTDNELRSDARALAVRFARAFADTIENSRRSVMVYAQDVLMISRRFKHNSL